VSQAGSSARDARSCRRNVILMISLFLELRNWNCGCNWICGTGFAKLDFGTGTVELELGTWYCGTGTKELELCNWKCRIGTVELELWYWNCGTGTNELKLRNWNYGIMEFWN
jgi:hypothetical protein